ncbi:MAG: helix-turn-helix transcriptional regulator [Synergistaceae bacterium]|nr:helix-turn-helix transcriptional regulator [Synergistaceae bacterium]
MKQEMDCTNLFNLLNKTSILSSESDFYQQLMHILVEMFDADCGGISIYLNSKHNVGDFFINKKNSDLNYYNKTFYETDPMSPKHYNLNNQKMQTAIRRLDSIEGDEEFRRYLTQHDCNCTLFLFTRFRPDTLAVISLNRTSKQPDYTEEDAQQLNKIAVMISNALSINAEFNINNAKFSLFMNSPIQEGVIFVDHNFRVLSYNQQAENICSQLRYHASVKDFVKSISNEFLLIGGNQKLFISPENEKFTLELICYPRQNKPIYMLILSPDKSEILSHLANLETLTRKEKKVVQLMSRGMTNKEIAETLIVSENTVKVHLKNIYTKMGVNNRTSLVAKMMMTEN